MVVLGLVPVVDEATVSVLALLLSFLDTVLLVSAVLTGMTGDLDLASLLLRLVLGSDSTLNLANLSSSVSSSLSSDLGCLPGSSSGIVPNNASSFFLLISSAILSKSNST